MDLVVSWMRGPATRHCARLQYGPTHSHKHTPRLQGCCLQPPKALVSPGSHVPCHCSTCAGGVGKRTSLYLTYVPYGRTRVRRPPQRNVRTWPGKTKVARVHTIHPGVRVATTCTASRHAQSERIHPKAPTRRGPVGRMPRACVPYGQLASVTAAPVPVAGGSISLHARPPVCVPPTFMCR